MTPSKNAPRPNGEPRPVGAPDQDATSVGSTDEYAALQETLAAIEHERWSHWQDYLHSLCRKNADGSLTIPSALVERWERQIETPYADLSETEKASDRHEVMRYWPLIEEAIRGTR